MKKQINGLMSNALIATLLFAFALVSTSALAQTQGHEVSLSDVTGAPGETVSMSFSFENTSGADSVLEARARISDVSVFSDIDVSNLCSSANTDYASCVLNDTNRIVISITNFDDDDSIGDFTGSIEFEIDANATAPATINVEWDHPDDSSELFTPTSAVDGSVIIEAAADDGSELAVTPTSHDFGTIDLGDNDSTTFTAENVGDADLDITDVGISGDSQFTIANDGCNGQTLTPGDTCEVDVDFDGDAEGTYSAEITFESDADVNDEAIVEVFGEVAEDNGADEGFTVDFDGGLGTGDAGDTLDSTGTVVYEGDTSGSLSCELSGDVFSSNPDPLDFTFAESGSEEFTISCTLPEDADDGQSYSGLLSCTDEAGEEVYTQDLGCSVTADEPEPSPAVPVPTMQSWGIALFSLIMLAIGGLSIRAFRS